MNNISVPVDKDTVTRLKNQFIINIIGTAMQYSPEQYMKLRQQLEYKVVNGSKDLFRTSRESLYGG